MKKIEEMDTTHASVASRLTDEDIAVYASIIESSSRLSPDGKCNIAAVLRDYVRLRKLENAVEDAFVKFAVQYEYGTIENADTRDMGREELANDEKWQALKRLIMETEKEAKDGCCAVCDKMEGETK